MRRFLRLTPLVVFGCVGILAAAVPGCELTTHAQAIGFVRPVDYFLPRRLVVTFVGGTDETMAQGVILSTGAAFISYNLGTLTGFAEIPLGYSIEEMILLIEAEAGVVSAVQDWVLFPAPPAVHKLISEDGTREVAWVREIGVDLGAVAFEFNVRVTGTFDTEKVAGIGVMDVETVAIVSDRVVQKGGTVTFIDRTADLLGIKVILVDDLRGEAWELVGTVADAIEAGVAPGTLIGLTGTELAPSAASFAGGPSLRVAAYVELTTEEAAARLVVTDALDDLTYSPSSDVWFLPVEFASGAIVRPPDVFGTTLDASGYLVFIDEDPPAAWPHTSQIVFVKTADPNAPEVIFNDLDATTFYIRDAAGDPVTGPWVLY